MSDNGAPPTTIHVQSPVVQFLEKLLQDAKNGGFTSMVAVMIGPQGQVNSGWSGGQLGELYVGCAMVQQGLLTTMTQPQKRPGIILARPIPGMNN